MLTKNSENAKLNCYAYGYGHELGEMFIQIMALNWTQNSIYLHGSIQKWQ